MSGGWVVAITLGPLIILAVIVWVMVLVEQRRG